MSEPFTSEDGVLKITRHSITYPTMVPKGVQGVVTNLDSSTVNAEIGVDFYDMSDNLLGSSTAVFKDVAPGEERLFDVWAERLPNMYETEYHKIKSLRVV